MHGDEHEIPRRNVRYSRRRDGFEISPPRVRDRASHGREWKTAREILDSLQYAHSKRTEDEQIAGQFIFTLGIIFRQPQTSGKRLQSDDRAVLYAAIALFQHP